MSKFQFLHTSDLHLDSPFLSIAHYSTQLKNSLIQAPIESFVRLCAEAIKRKVNFVLISGDVFDSSNVSLRIQERFFESIKSLSDAGILVYVISGNHDHDFFRKNLVTLKGMSGVHFFDGDFDVKVLQIAGSTIEIIGSKYDPAGDLPDISNLTNRDSFKICLYHGDVLNSKSVETYGSHTISKFASLNVDYWALGHLHKFQVLNERPYIVYAGTPQGRSFKPSETAEKGAAYIEVENLTVKNISYVKSSIIVYQELRLDLNWQGSAHQFFRDVGTAIEKNIEDLEFENSKKVLLRIRIDVNSAGGSFPDKANIIDLEQLISEKTYNSSSQCEFYVVDFYWEFISKYFSALQEDVISVSNRILADDSFLTDDEIQTELLKPRLKIRSLENPNLQVLREDAMKLINKVVSRVAEC